MVVRAVSKVFAARRGVSTIGRAKRFLEEIQKRQPDAGVGGRRGARGKATPINVEVVGTGPAGGVRVERRRSNG